MVISMKLTVEQSRLGGEVEIPASKSHTIRAVMIAALAEGRSRISGPLCSADTHSAVEACRACGAKIEKGNVWVVEGTGGRPLVPGDVIDVGNSGTTLRLGMGIAALCEGVTVLTGDAQIRSRPVEPLLEAYRMLGAEGFVAGRNGCAPVVIRGRMKGGRTEISAVTSQYLSSLLISTPLAEGDSEIHVLTLNEAPYVEMTLSWLDSQKIEYERSGWDCFRVRGGQRYEGFTRRIPGDFSSATFFLCAAAITGSELYLRGLDMGDVQGDKAVVAMLEEMGAEIEVDRAGVRIRGGELKGGEFDINDTPDALPAMAVTGCFASGRTVLRNVAQARFKETDRIAVMARELGKMGARVEEREDGLVIEGRPLDGAAVSGYDDHRVVMALAVAGLAAKGKTVIETAEAVNVTFPDFVELMRGCGAKMELASD